MYAVSSSSSSSGIASQTDALSIHFPSTHWLLTPIQDGQMDQCKHLGYVYCTIFCYSRTVGSKVPKGKLPIWLPWVVIGKWTLAITLLRAMMGKGSEKSS
jgi:hypothetical protein